MSAAYAGMSLLEAAKEFYTIPGTLPGLAGASAVRCVLHGALPGR